MPFREEEGIGHHHPLAFEQLQGQQHLASAGRFAGRSQPGDFRHAILAELGYGQSAAQPGRGGLLRAQRLVDVRRIGKAQRHVIALQERAWINRLQAHKDFLAIGQHRLFVLHIPLRAGQCQRAGQGQHHCGPHRRGLCGRGGRGGRRGPAQPPQHQGHHHADTGQHGGLIDQAPLQIVIKTAHSQQQRCQGQP